ncbi:YwqJ-related putative deaminase [Nocardiopsis sp. ARC36]
MTFEPTQPQDGVDPNMFTLIDPEAIPYPLTDVWSLNYAAETLRTGGENLLGGAEDMHSTWAGLQAHYVAPESETLFAAMDPVVTRGEDIQSDLATVADALEELAEAASTARSSLNTLRIEAQSFWNKHHDKKVWWLDKDDETDEWALQENIRLKDGVNTAWAAFNEAENACATRISALFGGPSYASPDQAGGDDVLVYGLPTDAGEREAPGFDETFMDPANDFTAWLGTEFHPSMASFSNSTDQAAWDILVVDGLWGSAVGLASLSGLWHPQGGWQITPSGRWENTKNTVKDGWMDAMTFIGVHDEQGWVADGAEGTRWDRWTTNIGASWDQAVEGHTAWSRREEDPEYTGSTSVLNTALMTVGIPLKIGTTVLTLGPGGEAITPSNRDGSYSDGSDQSSQTGGRLPVGPSSPLPQRLEEGSTPIGERFRHDLTLLRESLLDPDQYRNTPAPRPDAPSPTPNRPVVGDGGDQPSPTARPDTPAQRDDNAGQRAENGPERRPTSRTDDDETDGQGDDRPVRRDEAPSEEPARPETATGGGEGGGDQPPRDRTTTGGDDDSEEPTGDNEDVDEGVSGEDSQHSGHQDGDTSETQPREDAPRPGAFPESEEQPVPEVSEAPKGEPTPVPLDRTRGHILEQIDESRVSRNREGLIDSVDGKSVTDFLQDRVNERAREMKEMINSRGISQKELGGRNGAVNSVVLDRATGQIVEAVNGRDQSVSIPPDKLHPILEERLAEMIKNGPYPEYEYGTGRLLGEGAEYPHPDNPLRHAEVKAINELLWLRGREASGAVMAEFQMDNRYTLSRPDPRPAPCCPNCTIMSDGTPNFGSLKNTHPKWSDEAQQVTGEYSESSQ